MIIRLLICFGFMVLGAHYPQQTMELASILWNGLTTMGKQIGNIIV